MPRADSPEELARRSERIWWARQQGETWESIAKKENISRQTAIRDIKNHVKAQLKETGVQRELTSAIHESIVTQVSRGVPPRLAARAAMVLESTFDEWITLGRTVVERMNDEHPPSHDEMAAVRLHVAILAAEGQDVARRVERISEHGKTTFRADAYILDRRVPEFAPPTVRQEIKVDHTLALMQSELRDEALLITNAAQANGGRLPPGWVGPGQALAPAPSQPVIEGEVVSDTRSLLPKMPQPMAPKAAPARESVHPMNEQAAELERNTDTGRDERLEQRRMEYAERATRYHHGKGDREGESEPS